MAMTPVRFWVLAQDKKTQAVPIIFLSVYASPEQRVEGLLAGGVDFIGKPFNFDEARLRLMVHLKRPPVHDGGSLASDPHQSVD